jgi:uncharacterized protein YhaN
VKLLDLHLLAYGPFTDRHLDLSAGREGLHLVYGPNEAGKSSALRALRALLYGVPERTQDDFQHRKTELRVGGVLRGADGSELHCYRRKGRKGTLLDPGGEPMREDRLQRLLGGVGESLFERLFGIDHEALVTGGEALLVERGREAEALFGTGLGNTAVHALLEHLDQEAQSLFAPRASKPLINTALSRFTDLERQQREVSLSARHWEEARRAAGEAAAELAEADVQLAAEERRRSTLERIRRSLPALARRAQLREQIDALGSVHELAADFGQRREQALSEQRLAEDRRAKATRRLDGLRKDAAGLEVSEALLAEAEAVDDLRDRLGGVRKAARDRPALVAKHAHLVEQTRQRLAEIRPNLAIAEIEGLRPLLALRRRATELGGRQEALESAVLKAREAKAASAAKLEDKRDALKRLPPPISFQALKQAVAEARRAGDLDGAVAEAEAELDRHASDCRRDLESLGLWQGSLAELLHAPLPGEETLQRFAAAFAAVDEEQRRLRESIAEARAEQAQMQQALLALRLVGEIPTELELDTVRGRRDQGWQLLRRQWVDAEDVAAEAVSYAEGRPLHEVFEAEIAGADEIADRLRRESQRVHDQAAAQASLEAARQRKAGATAVLQQVAERRAELERDWAQAWSPIGIVPLPPQEMAGWMRKAATLREKAARGDELRAKADMLRRALESNCRTLHHALGASGQALPEPAEPCTLRLLLDHAEASLSALEQGASRRTALEESIAELVEAQRRSEAEIARAEAELAAWTREWGGLMQELGQRERASPGEVSDFLQSLSEALGLSDEARELSLRIDGIDREAQGFEGDAGGLVARLAPDLTAIPVVEAVVALGSRLTAQRQARSRRDELHKQAQAAEQEIRGAEAAIQSADRELADLCRQAGCERADELEGAERRYLEHKALASRLSEVETELIEGGDGLGIEALEREAEAVDRDSIVVELTALSQRIEQELRPEREARFKHKLDAERRFRDMAGGDEASALAEQAQQTLVELREHAENYVRVKLAARLLRDEIERFRRRHRDPILTAASAYFSRLTCGSLSVIDSDFDESDQPVLVGVRPTAERLRVEAMSTGTRDQLYLALRLATLDHYLESAEPLPFIVDDILIQFDDERSRATLAALADFSAKTQVILFTHHARVVEAARGLENGAGSVFVHELG